MKTLLLLVLAFLSTAAQAQIILPFTGGTQSIGVGVADRLYCTRAAAEQGGSFTKIAGLSPDGGASTTCGVAIYTDTDATGSPTYLARASASCPNTVVTPITGTGFSFTITAGQIYRFCYCISTTSATFMLSVRTSTSTSLQLRNIFSTGSSIAATTCTTGAPPDWTGVLTAATTSGNVPVLLVE